jgi:hypothetical protein
MALTTPQPAGGDTVKPGFAESLKDAGDGNACHLGDGVVIGDGADIVVALHTEEFDIVIDAHGSLLSGR